MRRLLLSIVLTGAALLTACRKQEAASMAASDPPPVAAAVIAVAAEPLRITVPVTGTFVSNTRVDVKAEVIGHIARFDKQEGDPVAAGEAVAWLDDENSRLALR